MIMYKVLGAYIGHSDDHLTYLLYIFPRASVVILCGRLAANTTRLGKSGFVADTDPSL